VWVSEHHFEGPDEEGRLREDIGVLRGREEGREGRTSE
jgi:hypothetical protein